MSELKDVGFKLAELKNVGFSASELKGAGFALTDLKNPLWLFELNHRHSDAIGYLYSVISIIHFFAS